MLFNSLEFALFLPIVFILYWFVFHKKLAPQNFFLLIASYVFYGWWNWRFLFLIFLSSVIDYYVSREIAASRHQRQKKIWLSISLISNLGTLCFFKYFNFFSDSFVRLFHIIGFEPDFITLNIILPVGISFYTFQTLSYTLDVYREKIEPVKDIVSFLAFVSFFPQLVAGPIERATDLLPQFFQKRNFDRQKAEDGLQQILWGLFKKMVIADNCSTYVDYVFKHQSELGAGYLLLGIFYFSFQIYCDFSGYSDVAIGTARLFGFTLNRNFAYPYFSRDPGEFWRRWHISLSTWFRDYVYIPLGGNRVNHFRTVVNTITVFTISGLWHGANWTFVFWGLLNGLYLLPLMLAKVHKRNTNIVAEHSVLPSSREAVGMFLTCLLTMISWIFFRSEDLSSAFNYLFRMLDPRTFSMPHYMGTGSVLPLIFLLIGAEWLQRKKQHPLQLQMLPQPLRWSTYMALMVFIGYFSTEQDLSFIYFQF